MSSGAQDRPASAWRKSSYCGGGECVEVSAQSPAVAIRRSVDANGSVLRFTRAEWQAFVAGVKAGEFDDLAR